MAGRSGWRATRRWLTPPGRRVAGLLLALLGGVVLATPVLAHGLFDGDPTHLWDDLLVSFGLPLVVLAIGALVGVALSKWLARQGDDQDSPNEEPVEGNESVVRREP